MKTIFNLCFAEATRGNVKIEHWSTSSLIRVVVRNEENLNPESELWFDYEEFRNLMKAIYSLTEGSITYDPEAMNEIESLKEMVRKLEKDKHELEEKLNTLLLKIRSKA